MDDEGEEGDEFRSSTVPNSRRRIVTKTPLEENKSDEGTMAAPPRSRWMGSREKAMRIANFDGVGASSSAKRRAQSRGSEKERDQASQRD